MRHSCACRATVGRSEMILAGMVRSECPGLGVAPPMVGWGWHEKLGEKLFGASISTCIPTISFLIYSFICTCIYVHISVTQVHTLEYVNTDVRDQVFLFCMVSDFCVCRRGETPVPWVSEDCM